MKLDVKLKTGSEAFARWFKQDALPLWSSRGIDAKYGASYERFLGNGEVDLQINPRVRVQARQIFTFCKAQELGWLDDAKPLVDRLVAFSQKYCMLDNGLFYGHLLSPSYELIDDQIDLYNHAFWILASAARLKVYKDLAAKQQAENLLQLLDSRFGSVCGGWLEGDYEAGCRRQNPHMHLFEATMAMYEASGEAIWLARAGELFSLFETRFFDAKYSVLREFFDTGWQVLDGKKGDVIEPGHMMEWVWLLRWYERISGHNVDVYANAMFDAGMSLGVSGNGLVYDAVDPHGNVLQATKRCWPLIELIKACIVQARAGIEGAEALAGSCLETLFSRYLTAGTPGLYIDQLGKQDTVCSNVAPASTLYHLIVVAEEVNRYVKEREKLSAL